jgi:hypothetical protein
MSENIFVNQNIDNFEEDEFLNSLSKNIRFGVHLYENILSKNCEYKLSDLVIISLYRKLLELSDGAFILLDQNSLGASKITARSIIEIYLSLAYILEDKNLIEKRALCYFLFHKDEELKILNKQYAFNLLKTRYAEKTLNDKKNSIIKMKREAPFKQIINDKKNLSKKTGRKYLKWYSIYHKQGKEIYSINDLINNVDNIPIESIRELYAILSMEVHGINAIQNIQVHSKKLFFDDIRGFNEKNERLFHAIRSLLSRQTINLVHLYSPELFKEFGDFFIQDRE